MIDVLIVGAGPAGLMAAVYALRAEKKVLILEKSGFGGQAALSPFIENFPGKTSISGSELADALVGQVIALGGEFQFATVKEIRYAKNGFVVLTEQDEYPAKSIILACGARHRHLGLPREEEFTGKGVSYCAVCDGAFYKDKKVCVIGGGNSALQEAILLSGICRQVILLQNLSCLTGEPSLIREVQKKDNLQIQTNCECISLEGEENFSGIVVKINGREEMIPCDGIFVAIGLEPHNEDFANLIALDENGYILAAEDCKTNVPGIFAAGDCRTKKVRQITTACADGTIAALGVCEWLRSEGENG